MDEIEWLADNADKATSYVLLMLFIFGLYSKKLYWGWQVAERDQRIALYEKIINDGHARTEAKLDIYERQQGGKPHAQ